jgi:hypothetical protein
MAAVAIYGNGLKLIMIFSPSRYISHTGLSPAEMLEISQEISRNYSPAASVNPPGFTAKIGVSPKEMFEISKEISRKYALKMIADTPRLVLLPVDPEHIYAYWNPGEAAISLAPENDFRETVLRIYPQPDENTGTAAASKSWYEIVVGNSRTQQKILLPLQMNASAYSAAIGKRYSDGRLAAFATSNTVHVPQSGMASHSCGEGAIIPTASLSSQEQPHYPSKNASGQGK